MELEEIKRQLRWLYHKACGLEWDSPAPPPWPMKPEELFKEINRIRKARYTGKNPHDDAPYLGGGDLGDRTYICHIIQARQINDFNRLSVERKWDTIIAESKQNANDGKKAYNLALCVFPLIETTSRIAKFRYCRKALWMIANLLPEKELEWLKRMDIEDHFKLIELRDEIEDDMTDIPSLPWRFRDSGEWEFVKSFGNPDGILKLGSKQERIQLKQTYLHSLIATAMLMAIGMILENTSGFIELFTDSLIGYKRMCETDDTLTFFKVVNGKDDGAIEEFKKEKMQFVYDMGNPFNDVNAKEARWEH